MPYTPSATTPMPPTTTPFLYSGSPPGSADRPSGERFGPTLPCVALRLTSEQESCENCTPKSGPLGACASPGLKFSWTICPAVRDEKALPQEERYAPVIALAIAACVEGRVSIRPSRP